MDGLLRIHLIDCYNAHFTTSNGAIITHFHQIISILNILPWDQCRIPFGLSYYCRFDIFPSRFYPLFNVYSHQRQYTVVKKCSRLCACKQSTIWTSKYCLILRVWVFLHKLKNSSKGKRHLLESKVRPTRCLFFLCM